MEEIEVKFIEINEKSDVLEIIRIFHENRVLPLDNDIIQRSFNELIKNAIVEADEQGNATIKLNCEDMVDLEYLGLYYGIVMLLERYFSLCTKTIANVMPPRLNSGDNAQMYA